MKQLLKRALKLFVGNRVLRNIATGPEALRGGVGGEHDAEAAAAAAEAACRVFVSNLPFGLRWEEVKAHADEVARPDVAARATLLLGPKGKPKGCAILPSAARLI